MITNSFYPVVLTKKVAECSAFYQQFFGFNPVFETGWYVSLKNSASFELAILDHSHGTVPDFFRNKTEGLILNFEVDDADAEYERLITKGRLPLHLDIRDEEFGQRHFITEDPSGTLLDIITVIPPADSFSDHYNENVWTKDQL